MRKKPGIDNSKMRKSYSNFDKWLFTYKLNLFLNLYKSYQTY